MTNSKTKRILALILCAAAVVLIVTGLVSLPRQNGSAGHAALERARIQALLNRFAGGADVQGDTQAVRTGVDAYMQKMEHYGRLELEARERYISEHYAEAEAELEAKHAAMIEAGQSVPDNAVVEVDMSDFAPTAEMLQLEAEIDSAFIFLAAELRGLVPQLRDEVVFAQDVLARKDDIRALLYQPGDNFSTQVDRYLKQGGAKLSFQLYTLRHADDLIYTAIALILVALLLVYSEKLIKTLGVPRVIIGVFFLSLCFMTLWYDLSLSTLLSNTVVRMGMNAVMVLAMVPGIQCGISLNLGLPIGLVAGLIGGLLTIELDIPGWGGFFFAILVGVVIAAVCGYLYAQLLNRLKGEEMSVTTYVGFSVVSLMCIAWLVLPFRSLKLRWPLGTGLRNTIGLDSGNFKHILNNWGAFQIGDFLVPTGLLLFMALCCFGVWIFSRSKTGIAMQAVGNNPRFAEATGINVNKMRVIGTVLSTVLGAIGILVYSQSYGFMQLYTAPRQMGFVAASAILIGGASTSRCRISHVLIGTFLFQGVLTLGMPVANVLVPGSTISETLRILISNGIILYALTKSGGASRA